MRITSIRCWKQTAIACLAALLVAVGLATITPQPAYASSANAKACKAYKEILSKTTIKWASEHSIKTKQLRFSCQDINKDGVTDLVIYNPHGSNATGLYRIYTYAKGKVKKVGQYTNLNVYPNNNYYTDTHTNVGHTYYRYYRLGKNGKATKLAAYEEATMEHPGYNGGDLVTTYEGDIASYTYNFMIHGRRATSVETMSFIQSLERGAKRISFLKNTASNRSKYVKSPSSTPKLSVTNKTLTAGKTYSLKMKNATGKKITWKSSNKKVATVSKQGIVTAKKAGSATITATVAGKKLTCKIKVHASANQKALAGLNGWWHTGRALGEYVCIKNGRMYRFPAELDEDYSIIGYSTSRATTSKLTLTRVKHSPLGDGAACLIKVNGDLWYCYNDNDRKTLNSWDGANYSGSSSLVRVDDSEVPLNLKKYMKKY